MIKCNLAVLLAERGLKMSDIINDTSLSKTAIRGLYYNTSKGVQYETLEIICDYLNVTPGDVIKKIDFHYEIINRNIDNKLGKIDYEIQFTYDTKKHLEVVTLALLTSDFLSLFENEYSCHEMFINLKYNNETKQNIFSQITTAEKEKLQDYLVQDFIKTLHLEQHEVKKVFINEP